MPLKAPAESTESHQRLSATSPPDTALSLVRVCGESLEAFCGSPQRSLAGRAAWRLSKAMSGHGTSETYEPGEIESASEVKPDIGPPLAEVGVLTQTGHRESKAGYPSQSGTGLLDALRSATGDSRKPGPGRRFLGSPGKLQSIRERLSASLVVKFPLAEPHSTIRKGVVRCG